MQFGKIGPAASRKMRVSEGSRVRVGLSWVLTDGAWHRGGLENNHWMPLFAGRVVFRAQTSEKRVIRKEKGQVAPTQVCFSLTIVLIKWQVSLSCCSWDEGLRCSLGGYFCPPWEVLCRIRESIELTALDLSTQDLEFGKRWHLKVTVGMVGVARWGVSSF